MRVVFFGGSFDPPHVGHVAVARAAWDALGMDARDGAASGDRVLFAPVGLQPLKLDGAAASFADRVAMTRLAIAGEVGFEVSLVDGPREAGPGKVGSGATGDRPNFTYDTLMRLRERWPEAELHLLMGADSLRGLRDWYRAAEIPFEAGLVVASRPGEDLGDLAEWLPAGIAVRSLGNGREFTLRNAEGDEARLLVLPDLHYEVSASMLRGQIEGSGAASLLADGVLRYIRARGLYGGS